jgi:hypothetical protein
MQEEAPQQQQGDQDLIERAQALAAVPQPPQYVGRPLQDLETLEDYENEFEYMNKHVQDHGLDFLSMDDKFHDDWSALKKGIRTKKAEAAEKEKEIIAYMRLVAKDSSKSHNPTLCGLADYMEQTANNKQLQPQRQEMQTVFCANKEYAERQIASSVAAVRLQCNNELAEMRERMLALEKQQQEGLPMKRVRQNDGTSQTKVTLTTTTTKSTQPLLQSAPPQQPRATKMFYSTNAYVNDTFLADQKSSKIATPSHEPAPEYAPLLMQFIQNCDRGQKR